MNASRARVDNGHFIHVVGVDVWVDDRPADVDWASQFVGVLDGVELVGRSTSPTAAIRATVLRSIGGATRVRQASRRGSPPAGRFS